MASAAAKAFERLVDDLMRGRARLTPRRDTLARVPGERHPLSTMTPDLRREYDRLRKADWRAARATANPGDKPQRKPRLQPAPFA